ncbi:MAG: MmcQ/YjbR family DNA-binding protein [Brevinematales bacterium]|nr:MmcQ/YjbR family DNA-binding protein [Brevinematales bacterium]
MLLTLPEVKAGKSFGFPAYSIGKKMFACVYEEGVSIKLPKERVDAIIGSDPDAGEFRPMNRYVMKEWVFIARKNTADYIKDLPLLKESVEFVMLQKK